MAKSSSPDPWWRGRGGGASEQGSCTEAGSASAERPGNVTPGPIPIRRDAGPSLSDQRALAAESCWLGHPTKGPGYPSLWHLSNFWESGNVRGRPLGVKMTMSDTGNTVSTEDLRVSSLCGHPSPRDSSQPRPSGNAL